MENNLPITAEVGLEVLFVDGEEIVTTTISHVWSPSRVNLANGATSVLYVSEGAEDLPDEAKWCAPALAAKPGILEAAAATAEPDQAPTPDLELEAAFRVPATQEQIDARIRRLYADGRAAEMRLHPLYSLEDARALPEVGEGEFIALESTDEREILAFKDEDGRTMRVVLHGDGLAKFDVSAFA